MIKALNLVSIKRENSLSMIELHPSNMGRDDEATQKYNSYCTQYTSGRSPRMPTNHGNKCRYFVLWSFWLVKITSSTLKLARTSKFYPFYKQSHSPDIPNVFRPSLCCLINLRGQTELPGEGSHSNSGFIYRPVLIYTTQATVLE